MDSIRTFRTRQAPSPTGYLHLGFVRQLLFTKLFALINDGIYFLRLEDTDRKRLIPESARTLVKNLSILGLDPDEGVSMNPNGQKDDFYGVYQNGDFGPYIQSERLDIYREHAQNLVDRGLAYWSYLTEADRQELQDIKKATKQPIDYFKANLEKFGEAKMLQNISAGLGDPLKPALNYKMHRQGILKCRDLLLGETDFDLSLEEDFVILKSDGFPTYHFAHLIDDYLMKTSLVLRAQEWYPSIAKHVVMYQDYWSQVPFDYLHVPFIMGETGNKKLSKRDGNVDMQIYLDAGYLPEAIINYLAFLGWNPGTEKELYLEKSDFMSVQDPSQRINRLLGNLATDFSIDKLSKSPARFNQEKLNWFNRQYISIMSLEEFTKRSFELKLGKTNPDKDLRVGDYVYLVDTKTQEVFGRLDNVFPIFREIGGGREANLSPVENLIKEVQEETDNRLTLDPEKLVFITKFEFLKDYQRADENKDYNGKVFNIYFYPLNKAELAAYTLADNNGVDRLHDWQKLSDVIYNSKFITYPIWKSFCEQNHLSVFNITPEIRTQFLAWNLDKNRVITLSEFGTESDCVLNWQIPPQIDLKWKKITLEESLANLGEILPVILDISKQLQPEQEKLLTNIFDEGLNEQFMALAQTVENKLKHWLMENQKDTGSYLWPLRVALSGKLKSPSPFELLAILNTAEVKTRITQSFSQK